MNRSHRIGLGMLLILPLSTLVSSPVAAQNPKNDALAAGLSRAARKAPNHIPGGTGMNGNTTREGIKADLEAMKNAGIGGAQIFAVSESIPAGAAPFMSPQYQELIRYAAQQANRLGIELCLHNCAGWSSSGGPWNLPANAMQFVTQSEKTLTGPQQFDGDLEQPATKLNFYRDIAVLAFPTPAQNARIENIRAKALYERGGDIEPSNDKGVPADATIARDKVLDLTAQMKNGHLKWSVPAGNWTIMRIGHTPTGAVNSPAPDAGRGPEVDKLSKSALDAHFQGMMQPLLDIAGPLAGKTINNSLIDSYEVGSQNWTPLFRSEFQRRRGYDLLRFLPVLSGRVVEGSAQSERFLWDFRRTVTEMMDENYFGHFAELCHERGLKFSTEPYGNGPFNDLTAGGRADIPMGEFWIGGAAAETCKIASSVGHIYGRNIIGAESFTAGPDEGRWQNDPYSVKAQGDAIFCKGVNRYIFHRYAMQPWLNRFPGMTMGQWGINFERTNTIWNPQKAWLQYITRCQYLLQQGRFVADVLYFSGENSPTSQRNGGSDLPSGYDWDSCSREIVMNQLSVRDGRLVLPSGMSYRVLILPPGATMTPQLAAKLRDLIRAGATIIGPRPTRSPSLENFPDDDKKLQQIAQEIWGDCDGKTITSHRVGKGQVFWGQTLPQVLAALKIAPDFSYDRDKARLNQIHRTSKGSEIYFVSNQRKATTEIECSFRATGTPQLFHPDSGEIENAPLYRVENGRTIVRLRFAPAGSVFVIFRPTTPREHLVSATFEGAPGAALKYPKLEILSARYEAVDGAGGADVTAKVASQIVNGSVSLQAGNDLFGDPINLHVKQLKVAYLLDGEKKTVTVGENQLLEIGTEAGQIPYPPFEWSADARGALQVLAWQNGALSWRNSRGQNRRSALPATPPMQEISGAWQLNFPPHWGAPAQVKLDKLISWTEHSDSGVRYFSGTATYRKTFALTKAQLDKNAVVSLDLGAVKNLARVRVNGVDLGVLWKTPFRVDVTRAARVGANSLEIEITNLWPNRLIGDEQLPDDREWEGKHLKAWPQWVLDGKPSPTGRFTFTTWHHWTKDSPLLESGLIGPVTLHFGRKVSLQK